MAIKLKVQSDPNVQLGVQDNTVRFGLGDNVQVVQSGDYDDLTNRPQINGVTLTGNKTTEDLGINLNYKLTYDELSSVGYAEIGEAKTGEPNYTPTGTVTGSVTTGAESFVNGGNATLIYYHGNYKLYISGINFTPTTTTKNIVTGIGNLNFTGNGVKFAVEQEN